MFEELVAAASVALECPPEQRTEIHIQHLRNLARTNPHFDRIWSRACLKQNLVLQRHTTWKAVEALEKVGSNRFALEENILRHSRLVDFPAGSTLDQSGIIGHDSLRSGEYFFTVVRGQLEGFSTCTSHPVQPVVTVDEGDGISGIDWYSSRAFCPCAVFF